MTKLLPCSVDGQKYFQLSFHGECGVSLIFGKAVVAFGIFLRNIQVGVYFWVKIVYGVGIIKNMSEGLQQAREFWLPLITTDGRLDETKIINELHDYLILIENAKEVYDYVTGCSNIKALTSSEAVIELFNAELRSTIQKQLKIYEENRKIDEMDFTREIARITEKKRPNN